MKFEIYAGTTLMEIYTHLLQTQEWMAYNGTRHVFFQSHTGFAHGRLGDQYEKFLCWQLINAMHVVNVHAQRWGSHASGPSRGAMMKIYISLLTQLHKLPALQDRPGARQYKMDRPCATACCYRSRYIGLVGQDDISKLESLPSPCRLKCPWYNPQDFIIAPGSVHYADIQEFQRAENQRMQRAVERDSHLKRDFLVFFKGKCTPLKFEWKELAVTNKIAESVVNVGKLMRFEVVNAIKGMPLTSWRRCC